MTARLGTTRAAHRRLERIVGVDVGLNQIELELRGHHRLPATRFVQLQHMAKHMPWRHGHATTIGIKTIVDYLRGGLGSPRHHAHRARIGLEHDVDLGRTHCRIGVERIVASYRLQKDALWQAQPCIHGELLGGHDLAARDTCHVGNDRLDFRGAMFLKELMNLTGHRSPVLAAFSGTFTR